MKHKRVWTDEQRHAAAERMSKMSSNRWAQKKQKGETPMEEIAVEDRPVVREVAPEVQAIVDNMEPARRAKLEQIQARNLAQLAQTKDGQEALARLEARHNGSDVGFGKANDEGKIEVTMVRDIRIPEPPKQILRELPMKVPFRLTGSISGLMVSELGPCQCGEQKLKWHPICVKVRV